MTDSRPSGDSAARARAAIKALRWNIAPPGSNRLRRGRIVTASVVMALGVAIGGLVGIVSEELLPTTGDFDSKAATSVASQSEPDIRPIDSGESDVADHWAEPTTETTLVPAAGPLDDAPEQQYLESRAAQSWLYEEPLDPDPGEPGLTIEEIDAAIDRVGLAPVGAIDEAPGATLNWQRNAVPVAQVEGAPIIAIVIDDLGLNRRNTWRTIDLPAPLTLAFMTYAEQLPSMTEKARAAGHELMVHVPMEPGNVAYDPGPNALLTGLERTELQRRLEWALDRFEGYVGVNNHMGSHFTGSLADMAAVMAELKSRGLMFLDSRTSSSTIGGRLAQRMGVASVERDVFIDNEPEDPAAIRNQLLKLENMAKRRGLAVGIGHPHDATIEVLAEWLPEVIRRGVVLVPITAIVQRRLELTQLGARPE